MVAIEFPSEIKLTPISSDTYKLAEDYTFTLITPKVDIGIYTIKAGYLTDGASIPRYFWRIFPPFSPEYITSATIHDHFCDKAEGVADRECRFQAYKKADRIFYYALNATGTKKLTTLIFYYAVRFYHNLSYIKELLWQA